MTSLHSDATHKKGLYNQLRAWNKIRLGINTCRRSHSWKAKKYNVHISQTSIKTALNQHNLDIVPTETWLTPEKVETVLNHC